ncbi:MAG: hypothetical protein B7X90_07340 [Novosphingobium sp. 17-62-19]|nr:MAG: hypothetical protein B7X90_07340 [Novosphingobium sp. 17-62-19]
MIRCCVHVLAACFVTAFSTGPVGAREAVRQSFTGHTKADQAFALLDVARSQGSAERSAPSVNPVRQLGMVEDALWSPSPFRTSALAPGSDRACGLAGISQQNGHSRIVRIRRARLLPIVASTACAEGVPVALLDALIIQESRYNSAAVSHRGAIGLTQLMPGTATALGVVNPWNALQNLKGGARYLKQQLDAFGRYDLALAAYNAGPGQVRRHKGVPPFRETRDYVGSVLGILLEGRAPAALILAEAKRPATKAKQAELMSFSVRPVTSTPQ